MPETHVPTMDEQRARRMVRDLVQGEMDAGAEGGTDLRASAVAALAAAAGAMLAMLHFSGDAVGARGEQNSSQKPSVIMQRTDPRGSLSGMPTNHSIGIPLAAAAIVSSSLCAAPPGYVLVADSQAQFSGEQGRDGWWYLFDRGEGTAVEQMPYFTPYNATPDNGAYAWCPEPIAGFGGSFCMLHRTWSHTNQSYGCDTRQAGLERPVRRWMAPRSMPLVVEVRAGTFGATFTSALQADLLVDSIVLGSWLTQYGSVPTIDATINLPSARSIDFRLDPVDVCAADGCGDLSIRIYAPDCNGNSVADYLDIAADPTLDRDHDGALDSCQCAAHPELCCPADLTRDGQVNGADLGAVLAFWGPNPAYPQADLNGDGRVDGADLGTLLANWGPCGQ